MVLHSLRWRLQVWHGLILVLVLTGFGVRAYHLALDNQNRRIDDELMRQLMTVLQPRSQSRPPEGSPFDPDRFQQLLRETLLQNTATQAESNGFYAVLWKQNGSVVVKTPGAPDNVPIPEELKKRQLLFPDMPPDGWGGPGPQSSRPGGKPGPGGRFGPNDPGEPFRQTSLTNRNSVSEPAPPGNRSSSAPSDDPGAFAGPGDPGPPPAPGGPGDRGPRDFGGPGGPGGPGHGGPDGPGGRGGFGGREGFGGPGMSGEIYKRDRGPLREFYRMMPRGDWLLVGRSLAPDIAAMRRLAYSLGAIGASVLILGLAGGWWVASRAIRPIDAISATAVKIAAGDLSQRINAEDTDSELGRLAGVLNSTFSRLEAAFAHQSRFTSDASHELRTPVTVILSQTQTALARERSAAEYRETLQACQRAAQRMRRLTESLLALARLDAGREPMKREPFDLARVARDCVEILRPLAAERNVTLETDLRPTEYLGDSERIGQVVTNLLSNAITYNREGGKILVATNVDGNKALLTVSDTGEGISDEDLPHVFERFYRVDKARSRARGGTGLGLAICKAIIDAHGGSIDVSSLIGEGSTFTVTLPRGSAA